MFSRSIPSSATDAPTAPPAPLADPAAAIPTAVVAATPDVPSFPPAATATPPCWQLEPGTRLTQPERIPLPLRVIRLGGAIAVDLAALYPGASVAAGMPPHMTVLYDRGGFSDDEFRQVEMVIHRTAEQLQSRGSGGGSEGEAPSSNAYIAVDRERPAGLSAQSDLLHGPIAGVFHAVEAAFVGPEGAIKRTMPLKPTWAPHVELRKRQGGGFARRRW